MKRILAALLALMMLTCAAAWAEEAEDDIIVEDVLLDDDGEEIPFEPAVTGNEEAVFTPSYGSPYPASAGGSSYWTLPMDITDEQAVWDMLMEPITVVDPGGKTTVKSQIYLRQEPDEESKPVGEITCLSQGLRVLETLDNGWSLVECYSSSFYTPRSKTKAWNLLVHGYVPTKYLKEIKPNPNLALVVDKLTQRVYVFQNGKLLSTLVCSTGLVMHNGKKYQPYNETRSGEFLMTSKVGDLVSDALICSLAIRFNGGDMIHEVPHVMMADKKTKNYEKTEAKLGTKCSHGCIRVQRYKTPEGVSMRWIWDQLKNNSNTKIVIWEDWQGRQLEYPADDTLVYYNPNGGQYYHSSADCGNKKKGITFEPFRYDQLDEGDFAKLSPCRWCTPPRRRAEIAEINAVYAPGGDHEELLNSLRQEYWDYLAE